MGFRASHTTPGIGPHCQECRATVLRRRTARNCIEKSGTALESQRLPAIVIEDCAQRYAVPPYDYGFGLQPGQISPHDLAVIWPHPYRGGGLWRAVNVSSTAMSENSRLPLAFNGPRCFSPLIIEPSGLLVGSGPVAGSSNCEPVSSWPKYGRQIQSPAPKIVDQDDQHGQKGFGLR